jgi:ParB family chromosome partitioning protein
MSMSKPEDTRPNRLGRGLSALLGVEEGAAQRPGVAAGEAKSSTRTLPIAQLGPSPLQPRRVFDEEALSDLTNSIKEKGVLQPILVRPSPRGEGNYEIIAGERRWRAAQRAGVHEVPVIIRELTDGEVVEVALIENVQRADLNGIEEARGYRTLIDQYGHTQDQLAKIIGKSRPHIANTLRLLALPQAVQALVEKGALSAGHGRALVGHPEAEALAALIAERGLSVREAEELARKSEAPSAGKARPAKLEKDANTIGLEKSIADQLGLAVDIRDKGRKGGEVRIAYKTLEQLDEICRRLQHSAA